MAQIFRFRRHSAPRDAEKDLVRLRWDQRTIQWPRDAAFRPEVAVPRVALQPSALLYAHKPLNQPLPPGTKLTLNSAQISQGVQRVALQLDRDYASRASDVMLIGILNGAMPFLTDLSRAISFSPVIDTLRTSSYDGEGHQSALQIEGLERLKVSGKEVVLVEDLVDTGRTTTLTAAALLAAGASNVRVAALISKPSKLEAGHRAPEYVAFSLAGDPWVLGYGMDGEGGKYRSLPYVAEIVR